MAVDGLIIPRSYNDYINKTDPIALSQALKQNNALDDAPTEDSRGGVRSGGVYTALAGKQPTLTFDNTPTDGSSNPVTSDGIYDALAGKQDTLTFDNTPTADSDNPVKSSGLVNSVPVDSVTADNMHSVTSNAVARAISSNGQSQSLILGTDITSTQAVYGTYNSRKLSDYRYLMFLMGVSGSIRGTAFIDRGVFARIGELYITAPHGNNYSQIGGIVIRYNDDTSFKMNTDGSNLLTYIEVIGVK